jgi:general secretion pathway protein M
VKDYINSLNERERWMVIGGGLCLALYLFYMLIYAPLSNKVAERSAQLTEKMATLDWMKKIKQQGPLGAKKQNVEPSKLLNLVATQLKMMDSIKLPYQLQQTSSGDVQLSFEEVPFNLFLNWLAELNKKYNISIKQFEATQTKTAGVTHILVIFSAG